MPSVALGAASEALSAPDGTPWSGYLWGAQVEMKASLGTNLFSDSTTVLFEASKGFLITDEEYGLVEISSPWQRAWLTRGDYTASVYVRSQNDTPVTIDQVISTLESLIQSVHSR